MAHLDNYYENRAFGSKVGCAKCGRLTPRRLLTRDGFTMSKVCNDCWDPAEEPEQPIHSIPHGEPL